MKRYSDSMLMLVKALRKDEPPINTTSWETWVRSVYETYKINADVCTPVEFFCMASSLTNTRKYLIDNFKVAEHETS